MEGSAGLLLAAYRVLGRSLSLARNAGAAVRLATPALAPVAALVLVTGPREAEWWLCDDRRGLRSGRAAVRDLPDWVRAAPGEPAAWPAPSGRWVLPDGAAYDGHGLVVSLPCGGLCPGVLVLAREVGFSDAERSVALEFAEPVGRAVTASLLYREQTHTVDTLRAALLPAALPAVPGVELAAAYRPAREALRIGGDLVHVERLADGGALGALGDVCGKGVEAAVTCGCLRQGLRVLHRVTTDPVEILRALNATVFDGEAADPTQFASMIAAVARPTDGGVEVRLAGGGHPPALVLRRDGAVQVTPVGGMLLGADGAGSFAAVTVRLRAGESCVLYTDGVTEAVGPGGAEFGLDRLCALLGEYAQAPAAVLADRIEQRAVEWLGGADHDDIAALVLRAPPTNEVGAA